MLSCQSGKQQKAWSNNQAFCCGVIINKCLFKLVRIEPEKPYGVVKQYIPFLVIR